MKLYHGSPIKKELLIPKQAMDVKKSAGRQVGVYATNKKDRAIAMALIRLKGITGPKRLNFPKGKAVGTIFDGWPKQKYFYLYTIDSKDFKRIDSWQWITYKEIKPKKTEKLKTSDYVHMLRVGSERERKILQKMIDKFKKRNIKELTELKKKHPELKINLKGLKKKE